ncbi:thioesterase family protein [Pseudomonas sp. 30_B]|uniref:acyl-CoA thioesterase n=1 Tax=Pseudomonas sp. 30_B TaxID=2813575 RepID=UPI001A9E7850|nr:acyl-CoA thioesterase [Pseudomonas sp. 30_B]
MPNRIEIEISWGDCDPAGIVFYPNYFAYFNRATDALFASIDLPLRKATERYGIVGWPMVDTRARFLKPSSFGDILRIETHVAELRRSSFTLCHRAFHADGALAVEGHDIRVWTGSDGERLASREIPAEVRALLVGHQLQTVDFANIVN